MKENGYLAISLNKLVGQEVNRVLEQIRAEIENYDNFILCANGQKGVHIDAALDIIDKHKVKSEGTE